VPSAAPGSPPPSGRPADGPLGGEWAARRLVPSPVRGPGAGRLFVFQDRDVRTKWAVGEASPEPVGILTRTVWHDRLAVVSESCKFDPWPTRRLSYKDRSRCHPPEGFGPWVASGFDSRHPTGCCAVWIAPSFGANRRMFRPSEFPLRMPRFGAILLPFANFPPARPPSPPSPR
jgi:hypothetical protein